MAAETRKGQLLALARRRRQWAAAVLIMARSTHDLAEKTRLEGIAADQEAAAARFEKAAEDAGDG